MKLMNVLLLIVILLGRSLPEANNTHPLVAFVSVVAAAYTILSVKVILLLVGFTVKLSIRVAFQLVLAFILIRF